MIPLIFFSKRSTISLRDRDYHSDASAITKGKKMNYIIVIIDDHFLHDCITVQTQVENINLLCEIDS